MSADYTPFDYQMQTRAFNDGKMTHRVLNGNNPIFSENAKNGVYGDYGSALMCALGMCGESGEVADIIKKAVFHEKPLDLEHLKREIGDVLWYVSEMCNAFGFRMSDVMHMNIDKLSARYPNGFNPDDANHRRKGDI